MSVQTAECTTHHAANEATISSAESTALFPTHRYAKQAAEQAAEHATHDAAV